MREEEFQALPENWQNFVRACECCRACPLGQSRTQAVVWRGALQAPLMLIGEGPGAEEDRLGRPFVGRSGKLLDDLLMAQEFRPEDVHICNIVKCRPPGNRAPEEAEAACCKSFLKAQFLLVRPRIIVLCGATAYRYFTGRRDPISQVRGRFIEEKGYLIMPTFHPAYILRSGGKRPELWQDMAQVREKMVELGLTPPLLQPLSGAQHV